MKDVVSAIIKNNGNVVIDGDVVDAKKRESLKKFAGSNKCRLVFVRTICDRDVMIGRMITAKYKNSKDDFFGGASTPWKGGAQSRGAVVKLREMWRRTPHHYRWENKKGGRWVLKKLPYVYTDIDTTDSKKWKKEVKKVVHSLLH